MKIRKMVGATSIVATVTGLVAWTSMKEADAELVSVSGTVVFRGTPPAPRQVDMGGDRYCEGAHATPLTFSPVTVGDGGGLHNVLVYVKGTVPGNLAIPDEEVLLNQEGCEYQPRVVALMTEQTLLIRNSDATLHNVHVFAERNRSFNIGQPIEGIQSRKQFDEAEAIIDVKCDVHGWMRGYIAVFDHPYFAVTRGDGAFSLGALPPGEYVVVAWHEELGTIERTVAVSGDAPVDLAFEFGS